MGLMAVSNFHEWNRMRRVFGELEETKKHRVYYCRSCGRLSVCDDVERCAANRKEAVDFNKSEEGNTSYITGRR